MVVINIGRKTPMFFGALIVFVVVMGFAIAYNSGMSGGNPAVMGHSADEVMVRNSTGSLVSLQTFINQISSGDGLSCHFVQNSSSTSLVVTVSCDSGVRTGGGCALEGIDGDPQGWRRWHKSIPINPNGWLCVNEDAIGYNKYTAYVVCCN